MKEHDIGELARVIAGLGDEGDVALFLQQILTPAEVHDLVLRWELVKKVYEGVPQRTIASELGISLCKVTRGSKELKREGSLFRSILERSHEIETSAE